MKNSQIGLANRSRKLGLCIWIAVYVLLKPKEGKLGVKRTLLIDN